MLAHLGRIQNLPKYLGTILFIFGVQFIVLSWYFGVSFQDLHGQIFNSNQMAEDERNKPFHRAIIVYFPMNHAMESLRNLQYLHRSWIEIQKYEPQLWRTDLLIYTNGTNMNSQFHAINCTTTLRQTNNEPNQCILIPTYQSIQTPSFPNEYVDSIHIGTDSMHTHQYQWTLRTDLNTILTPAFSTWKPFVLSVGERRSSLEDRIQLHERTTAYQLKSLGVENIGTTWYGPSKQIQSCAKLAVKLMQQLKEELVIEPTNAVDIAHGAIQLALNHCAHGHGIEKRPDMLDVDASSLDSTLEHAHIYLGNINTSLNVVNLTALDPSVIQDYTTYIIANAQRDSHQNDSSVVNRAGHAEDTTQFPINAKSITDDSFLRAAVIFIPVGAEGERFVKQLRWFRRSWQQMQLTEPSTWRTDIVIFTNGHVPALETLNCSTKNIRMTREEPNQCIVIDNYTRLKTKEFDYAFGDSINVMAQDVAVLSIYEYLLRTDIDTFLTPAFSTWKPQMLTVGRGAYSFSDKNGARLKRVIHEMGYHDSNVSNVGSTWYGPASLVRTCAKLAIESMQYLDKNEFTAYEKSKEYGIQGWPEWHYGVLSMYAGHIAINHCTKESGVVKNDIMLDYPTSSTDTIENHAHLHTWQNGERFSKFTFFNAGYPNEKLQDLNLSIVNDYAMYMALDSLPTTPIPAVKSSEITSFVRAAVVFLPYRNREAFFVKQFRWFWRSWIEMQKHEPHGVHTDIIVFSNGPIDALPQFNCSTTHRVSRFESNRCVLVPDYTLLRSTEFDYQYGDSINVVAVNSTLWDSYDWILRTDIDVFLTPAFATWKPNQMTIGGGGYQTASNFDRLARISSDLGLNSSNLRNVGSTWYGPSKLVHDCAELTVKLMKYLHEREFTALEKSVEYGTKGWPEWHHGVLSLYAGHLAINHCTFATGVVKDEKMLDFATTSDESTANHAHLHAWQNRKRFSKFEFDEGAYANEDRSKLSLEKVSDYAMFIALDSQETQVPVTPATVIPAELAQPFLRAAVLFLPTGTRQDFFVSQFRWFQRSWKEMQKYEPTTWRTDIVVLSNGVVDTLTSVLGCTTDYRKTPTEANRCVVVSEYKTLQSNTFQYAFGDSIGVVAQDIPSLQPYDWILRTDIDTFLTPAFATWKPTRMVVGEGGYSFSDTNAARLSRIIHDMNLTDSKLNNIGSTWYGPRKQVRDCGILTVNAMKYLDENEFSTEEKSAEYGTKGWPEWHHGVLSMYAGHIAINHCTAASGVEKNASMLDYPSTSSESPLKHAHIHTWPDDAPFSKFAFEAGAYGNISIDLLDYKNSIKDYAKYMALESHGTLTPTSHPPETPVREISYVLRAAVLFLPTGVWQSKFLRQFRSFHRSWIEMQKYEPENWRTDIVVVSNGAIDDLEDLNCTATVRTEKGELGRCIAVSSYSSMRTEEFKYPFGDSINILAMDYPAFEPYDWILRTDADTFLTPAFSTWDPKKFVVGGGSYSSVPDTLERLNRIAKHFNMSETTINNVGSTWYGPADLIRKCAKSTTELMYYMYSNEFTDEEMSPEYGNKGWPQWHFGVLSMYAAQIAVNHWAKDYGMVKDPQNLDFWSNSKETYDGHAHVHCWQQDDRFSKLKFVLGEYENFPMDVLDLHRVNDYSTYMALDSHRDLKYQYTRPPPLTRILLRAVVVYLPQDAADGLLQFRRTRRSWIEMLKTQFYRWRTDLVVYTDGDGSSLAPFNCTKGIVRRRQMEGDDNQCILVPNYKANEHIDELSLHVLTADSNQLFDMYEWIMHMHPGSLLTPEFSNWAPIKMTLSQNNSITASINQMDRLKVTKDLRLDDTKIEKAGSTWYGPGRIMRYCANLTFKVLDYLEANATEKIPREELFQEAQQLALNHCTREHGAVVDGQKLGYSTTSSDKILGHVHLAGVVSPGEGITHATDEVQGYAQFIAKEAEEGRPVATLPSLPQPPLIRAIVAFIPTGKEEARALQEFRLLHQSWLEMIKHQPLTWRTDLVVFSDGRVNGLAELNCSNWLYRMTEEHPSICVVIDKYKLVEGIDLADGYNVVAYEHIQLSSYKWILRTDTSTLVTPTFANWKPEKMVISTDSQPLEEGTIGRLNKITEALGYSSGSRGKIGATWYGPNVVVRKCANVTVEVMKYIHSTEGSATDSSPEWNLNDVGKYARHIALNHCTADDSMEQTISMLDIPTDSTNPIKEHAHLRLSTASERFSMVEFIAGRYSSIDKNDLDVEKISDYALNVAMESHRSPELMPKPIALRHI